MTMTLVRASRRTARESSGLVRPELLGRVDRVNGAGGAEASPDDMLSMREGYLPAGCMASVSKHRGSDLINRASRRPSTAHVSGPPRPALVSTPIRLRPDLRRLSRRVPVDHDSPRRLGQHHRPPIRGISPVSKPGRAAAAPSSGSRGTHPGMHEHDTARPGGAAPAPAADAAAPAGSAPPSPRPACRARYPSSRASSPPFSEPKQPLPARWRSSASSNMRSWLPIRLTVGTPAMGGGPAINARQPALSGPRSM